jgi:hypothetical protein
MKKPSSQPTSGASHLFSIATKTSGLPAPAPSGSGSTTSTKPGASSAASSARKWSRVVPRLQIDINRGIAEAIDAVVTPAACARAGKIMDAEELAARGMREERTDDVTGQFETEFFLRVDGKYETIALLIATPVGDKECLIQAEAGSNFDT